MRQNVSVKVKEAWLQIPFLLNLSTVKVVDADHPQQMFKCLRKVVHKFSRKCMRKCML